MTDSHVANGSPWRRDHIHDQYNISLFKAPKLNVVNHDCKYTYHITVSDVFLLCLPPGLTYTPVHPQSLMNPLYEGSLPPVYVVTAAMAVWAFFSSGGSLNNLSQFCTRKIRTFFSQCQFSLNTFTCCSCSCSGQKYNRVWIVQVYLLLHLVQFFGCFSILVNIAEP